VTLGDSAVPSRSMNFRNKIINGDMRIDQRNAGVSVSLNSTSYTLDRWNLHASGLDEAGLNVSQYSMNASDLNSTGFSNALKVEVGTTESSIAADEYAAVQQRIEAQNLTDLKFGTANAKSLMLSFWVKTSLSGTYGITLQKLDTTHRLINKSFTTTTTDWEEVTIPITGDTDSNALISDDNGEGFRLSFWLGAGSDYTTSSSNSWINYSDPYWAGSHQQNAFLTTQNATFYITGVQLEEGSVPTPFEHRPYGVELSLCQRYYEVMVIPSRGIHGHYSPNGGLNDAAAFHGFFTPFKQTKRITPIIPSVTSNSAWAILSYSNYSAQTTHTFRAQAISTEGFSPVANRVAGNNGPSLGSVYSWQTTVTYHIDAEF
jgi:hypothetical protein